MTKIDIFSGFLGAGKTTLIKKLIAEAFAGEKLVLIENEFGEIGIDGGFMQDAGIQVTEMSQGCICCSLVGDFGEALKKVLEQYAPDRILIEPSGVGKLSDVIRAVQGIDEHDIVLNSFTTVVDAKKCKMYMKNFGEFFNNQVEHAGTLILSRTGEMSEEKVAEVVAMLREKNANAVIITTDWKQLDGRQILEAMEHKDTLEMELKHLSEDEDVCPVCGHHHHHDDDDDDDDEDEHEHHHHHHDHDDDEDDEHEHHHHDGECCCCHHDDDDDDDAEHEHEHHHDHEGHEHHHHHHHGHDADEVFGSWGVETPKKFSVEEMETILGMLEDQTRFGAVLRAKGIVPATDGKWIHFDYVPGEQNIRYGSAGVTGRLCVIGSKLNETELKALFGV